MEVPIAYINLRRLSADSECGLVWYALYAFCRRHIIKHGLSIPFTTRTDWIMVSEISSLAKRGKKNLVQFLNSGDK